MFDKILLQKVMVGKLVCAAIISKNLTFVIVFRNPEILLYVRPNESRPKLICVCRLLNAVITNSDHRVSKI